MTDSSTIRRVSYSQYTVWATCPKQWKLKYVDGLKEPTNINLLFGTSIHEAIQNWLDVLYNKSAKQAALFDLEDEFKIRLLHNFKEAITTDEAGNKVFPSTQEALSEFYQDGVEILRHVKQYKDNFFPTKGWELVGCEIELDIALTGAIKFVGFIDIVLREKRTGQIRILDLKTSKRGWWDSEKKDPKKLNQILLYKQYYSEQFGVDQDLIDVEFVILKRKINIMSEWKQVRISRFEPANGAHKVKSAVKSFNQFVSEVFNIDGTVKSELPATPSESNCRFCYFKNKPNLCSESHYAGSTV